MQTWMSLLVLQFFPIYSWGQWAEDAISPAWVALNHPDDSSRQDWLES